MAFSLRQRTLFFPLVFGLIRSIFAPPLLVDLAGGVSLKHPPLKVLSHSSETLREIPEPRERICSVVAPLFVVYFFLSEFI